MHARMFSRREFLIRSAAASALAVCPPAPRLLCGAGPPERQDIAMVLFDRRSAQGVAFGLEAARRGVEALAIDDDAGTVWMHEIAPIWQAGTRSNPKAAAIAGLTSRVPLFCLELLGRDYGMRVVYRVQHAEAGTGWGAAAARLALSCRVAAVADSRLGLMDLEPDGDAGGSLFSWVMAPVDSARALSGRRA
jgi:hypothetical protein